MSTRARIKLKSWHTRRPRENTRSGLRVRARRLACSTLPTRVVVGMVSASAWFCFWSQHRSIGWAQGGIGLMGFVVFAGFAACIAWSARAGRSRAAGRMKCPGTRSALLKSANAISAREKNHSAREQESHLWSDLRYTDGTHTAHICGTQARAISRAPPCLSRPPTLGASQAAVAPPCRLEVLGLGLWLWLELGLELALELVLELGLG